MKHCNKKSEKSFGARYARQIALPELGVKGQRRLVAGSVLVVGAGGLGSPVLLYLAAAGVGRIGVVDFDKLDISNLQRQILYTTEDIGRSKAMCAAVNILKLNPDVEVAAYNHALTAKNAGDIFEKYDIVIDATDNFETKSLIAKTCLQKKIPYIHGGIKEFSGQALTVLPGKSCCLACLKEGQPKAAKVVPRGPLGVVPGVIGAIQAAEAIKYIVGIGKLLVDRLLLFDALKMDFRIVNVKRNVRCSLCGNGRR